VTDLTTDQPSAAAITVSELNRQARRLLEQGLSRLWIEGEVSNLARPASGHVYFTLKDESAQLRCAWFRQRQRGPTIHLKNGDKMLALGKVSIYEARGDYQMIVERMEDAGEGELRRRFEELKKKLQAEGLFDDDRKQAIPLLPGRIGIITSTSGAAVRDILTVLRRRFPLVPVIVYPSSVQGDAAASEVVAALKTAADRDECDVLIVSRGGGSLEDLWPFNEEAVARAISDSPIPIVSAVGHEVDFTIADFVADLRAPTPTAAAELVVPNQNEWKRRISATAERIAQLGSRYVENSAQSLDWLSKRLAQSSPAAIAARQRAWLANLQQLMAAAMRHDLTRRSADLHARLNAARHRLQTSARNHVQNRQNQLNVIARGLHSVSPLATLERGYSIVTDSESGRLLQNAATVSEGTSISARLARGRLSATVTKVHEDKD